MPKNATTTPLIIIVVQEGGEEKLTMGQMKLPPISPPL
jgi:hypothetical protein